MAYRVFYDAYLDRLSRYLLVVTRGNEETMREALQATMIRVVRHIRAFSDEAVFWSWLTVLARSALIDESRKRHRYLAFLDRFRQHSASHSTMRDEEHGNETLVALLDRSLASLPVDERELVERKYFERLSVREIADRLTTSEKAVESRLMRVRRKLKQTMLEELGRHDA